MLPKMGGNSNGVGIFACCVILLLCTVNTVNSYSKYGRGCQDIGCLPSEECVITQDSCSYSQREGKDCGSYPTCKKKYGASPSSSSVPVNPSENEILQQNETKNVEIRVRRQAQNINRQGLGQRQGGGQRQGNGYGNGYGNGPNGGRQGGGQINGRQGNGRGGNGSGGGPGNFNGRPGNGQGGNRQAGNFGNGNYNNNNSGNWGNNGGPRNAGGGNNGYNAGGGYRGRYGNRWNGNNNYGDSNWGSNGNAGPWGPPPPPGYSNGNNQWLPQPPPAAISGSTYPQTVPGATYSATSYPAGSTSVSTQAEWTGASAPGGVTSSSQLARSTYGSGQTSSIVNGRPAAQNSYYTINGQTYMVQYNPQTGQKLLTPVGPPSAPYAAQYIAGGAPPVADMHQADTLVQRPDGTFIDSDGVVYYTLAPGGTMPPATNAGVTTTVRATTTESY